ncbi:uncharacterized protein LOC111051995 [Nilaparvata lugens]|uniref:uncharacterized protein LOC111051995 n=1 Tax=Nilaparvata lugens TaxID=108931 RepID=UPI00193D1045|nr:uncharacterized protein LOC111051995 [Nilaparvata lugens]
MAEAGRLKSKALYSTLVSCLGLACFGLALTALILPLWGYFDNPRAGPASEKGYFGPWQICKQLLYGRTKCGNEVTRFRPVVAVKVSGYMASASTLLLFFFCVLSVLQLAMVTSRDKVVLPYSSAVTTKLVLALISTLLAIMAGGLFALQTDDTENDFVVSRGESFYIQVVLIILNFMLFIAALYDVLFSRRLGGDPTMSSRDPNGVDATTFNNPGFLDKRSSHPGGISMTDASGKPYSRSGTNGSVATLSTTISSNGSTVGSITKSPLRSSLKKPRPANNNGIGIQNPGFSGSSPTPSRNGNVKKVRIQTQSTAV